MTHANRNTLRWVDTHTVAWTLPTTGELTEYRHFQAPRIAAMIGDRARVGLVLDLRRARRLDAHGRVLLRSGLREVAPSVFAVALVVHRRPAFALGGMLGMELLGALDRPVSTHRCPARAQAWLASRRAALVPARGVDVPAIRLVASRAR